MLTTYVTAVLIACGLWSLAWASVIEANKNAASFLLFKVVPALFGVAQLFAAALILVRGL